MPKKCFEIVVAILGDWVDISHCTEKSLLIEDLELDRALFVTVLHLLQKKKILSDANARYLMERFQKTEAHFTEEFFNESISVAELCQQISIPQSEALAC